MHGEEPVARILQVHFTDTLGEVMTVILLTDCLKAIAKTLHNAHALLDLRFLMQALSMRPESWIGDESQRVSQPESLLPGPGLLL